MTKTTQLVAPFPYFGGKRRHVEAVWDRLGDPQAFVEPFCGSAAVLLGRPESGRPRRRELINDSNGWVANFWRAVKADPESVASFMDWPVSQVELAARQRWFDRDINPDLRGDPEWFDTRLAGVWAWGNSCSISSTYPNGSLNEQPSTKTFQGSNQRHVDLSEWCARLAERLRYVQVHAGNWELALRPAAHMNQGHTVGVFLDPPYNPAKADTSMYEHGDTWETAAEWAFSKGDDDRYRILLCGYQGSYTPPEGWTYQPLGNVGKYGGHKEGMWVSPHCIKPT